MPEVVVFPDAVRLSVDFLRAALVARTEDYAAGAKVGTIVPNPIPLPFVSLRRAGGVSADRVMDRPRVDVVVWHKNAYGAQALAQLCRGLFHAAAGSVWGGSTVYRVADFVGPTQADDPETGTPRYLFSVEIMLRGATTL